MKEKKRKVYDDDDGRTVCNMNVDGMPWYRSERARKNSKEIEQLKLTKKEKRALVWAAFKSAFPFYLSIICGFILAFLLLYLFVR